MKTYVVSKLILGLFLALNASSQQKIDSGQSKKGLLPISGLVSVFETETKDKPGILKILQAVDSNWKFDGKDQREIVFSIKKPVKGLVSWHFKETYLVYFFFQRSHFENIEQQVSDSGFTALKNETPVPGQKIKLYRRDHLMLKLGEITTSQSADNFFIIIQKAF